MSRLVTRDVELRGQTLAAGDVLVNFYPSANRDEGAFERAGAFDIRRDPNHHIAFGFGPHFCLGAALARLELRVMFRELIARLDDLELAPGDLPIRASNFVGGFEGMPVQFSLR
jgi:cytochrome P450 family 142 subfamily A polypeptide 1